MLFCLFPIIYAPFVKLSSAALALYQREKLKTEKATFNYTEQIGIYFF